MTIIYGIKNCDTVKKALKWLQTHHIAHSFHDFKTDGLSKELLDVFLLQANWPILLNKRSTTYRQLPDAIKENLTDEVLFNTVLAQPTLLKRPLLIHHDAMYVGFNAQHYQELFIHDA